MKELVLVTLSVIFCLCLGTNASAQTDVRSIDAYSKKIDAFTSANKRAVVVIADTSDYTDQNSKAKWRKFASEKALETFRDKTEVYNVALNWLRGGKVIASNMTLSSPSGDWAKYVYHYFREDGTLARVKIDYRTFQGDFLILQNRYFDRNGKLLKKTTAYQDLQTHKPKKPGKDYAGSNASFLAEDIYKTTVKLPFARVIR